MVVVPLTTLFNWQRELQECYPSGRVVAMEGRVELRAEKLKEIEKGKYDILLMSFEPVV